MSIVSNNHHIIRFAHIIKEIRVNWAYQSNNSNKEDTSNHFHTFVGDLSNEVNDEVLLQAFSDFGFHFEARVM